MWQRTGEWDSSSTSRQYHTHLTHDVAGWAVTSPSHVTSHVSHVTQSRQSRDIGDTSGGDTKEDTPIPGISLRDARGGLKLGQIVTKGIFF